MAVPTSAADRKRLRRELRQQRRNFCGPEREQAETCVARRLLSHRWFLRARYVAVYMAFDGELDLTPILNPASQQRKQLFAPQLNRSRWGMCFVNCGSGATAMGLNQYGIREPTAGRPIDPRSLDLVLVPLVAFDDHGTRLGMGGGHYDRLFSFLRTRRLWRHPKLLGVGFELQRHTTLPKESWDISLHGAITEQRIYYFS